MLFHTALQIQPVQPIKLRALCAATLRLYPIKIQPASVDPEGAVFISRVKLAERLHLACLLRKGTDLRAVFEVQHAILLQHPIRRSERRADRALRFLCRLCLRCCLSRR